MATSEKIVEVKEDDLQSYVEKIKSIEKKKADWMKKPDEEVDEEYKRLQDKGKILCDDTINKESKVDRLLTINEFPAQDFVYRELNLDPEVLEVLEKDWEHSTDTRREVFRTLCLDKKKNKIHVSTEKVDGSATSVAADWTLCEKSFPNKDYDLIGSTHTHPDFLDKPIESLGDVLTFANSDKEMYACTVTKWGTKCMYRMKEPALVFDIPRMKRGIGAKTPEVVKDKQGKVVYDVKSDVVDWNRSMKFANRNKTDSIFVLSRGHLTKSLTEAMARVGWYKPNDEEKSVGTVEAPFQFGKERSEPRIEENMTCESFVDIYGASTKIRTVCDGGNDVENFYVESSLTPGRLFFYKNNGFPTNFYFDKNVKMKKIHPLSKERSKFWDYVDKERKGYFKTRSEVGDDLTGNPSYKNTIRAAKFVIDGKYHCEYLLLPYQEGIEEEGKGKPGGILCRKTARQATEKTCVLTSTTTA